MSAEKPYAFLKGTSILKHASLAREGEEFEVNCRPVSKVVRLGTPFFRYNPRSSGVATVREMSLNPRESAAHVVTKDLLRTFGCLYCMINDSPILLRLRDVELERRIDNCRPDITGIVVSCSPHWGLVGCRMHVEVHFENAVRDPRRIAALQALGEPVLEFHLPKRYLKEKDPSIAVNEPNRFYAFLYAILTQGKNAGKWIVPPPPMPPLLHRNVFTGAPIP